jgi:hypothetical protein
MEDAIKMKKVAIFCSVAFLLGCGSVKGWFENGNVKASSESPLKVRELRIRVIEDVVGCKELLDEKATRPQACGKCELVQEGQTLKVVETGGCPQYSALGCTTKDGKVFVINNLSCEPVAEGIRKGTAERGDVKTSTYIVRVVGEDCIAYIRAKKNTKILYTRDYGGQFDVAVQMDPKTAEEVKTMGCVKGVSK